MTAPHPHELLTDGARPRFRYVDALYRMLNDYTREVEDSQLSEASKVDYIYFATCFVRWLHNDYTPGQGVQ